MKGDWASDERGEQRSSELETGIDVIARADEYDPSDDYDGWGHPRRSAA